MNLEKLQEMLAKQKGKQFADVGTATDRKMKKGETAPEPKPKDEGENDNKAEKEDKVPSGGKTLTGQKANKINVDPYTMLKPVNESLTPQQRQKRAIQFKRMHARVEIGRTRALRQRAGRGRLMKRSRRLAIKNLQKRVLRTRKYSDLSYGERSSVDKRIKRSRKAIKRMASRLMPRVARAEATRKLGGAWLSPMRGAPVTESSLLQMVNALPNYDYEMTMHEQKSLQEKALEHDLPVDALETVYRRGITAWELEETELSFQQFAFNRVNSFLAGGAAYDMDYDIVLEGSAIEGEPLPSTNAVIAAATAVALGHRDAPDLRGQMPAHRTSSRPGAMKRKHLLMKIFETTGGKVHLDHTYDYGDHARIKDGGKKVRVHQISPTGSFVGVEHPKSGKHIGYYHVSDLKKIEEDAMAGDKRRVDMPQIAKFDEFKGDLNTAGHKLYEPVQFKPEDLTPYQKHFNQEKVDDIIKNGAHKDKPIIVSKDHKIVDGHHRWEAARQAGDKIAAHKTSLTAAELMAFVKGKPYIETKKLHESAWEQTSKKLKQEPGQQHFDKAMDHYEKAGQIGDRDSSAYHHHMANHHDLMASFTRAAGRSERADNHDKQAASHVRKGKGLTEEHKDSVPAHELPSHVKDAVSKVHAILKKHKVQGVRVSVAHHDYEPKNEKSSAGHHEVNVELGHHHIANDRLVHDLCNSQPHKWTHQKGDVVVAPCASIHPGPKHSLHEEALTKTKYKESKDNT